MRRPHLLKTALASFALVVATYGSAAGASHGEAKRPANESSHSHAIGKRALKVGMIAPIGPPDADIPEMPAALSAGIRALNERGGIHGRPVQLIYCNDRDDPGLAVKCAKQMVKSRVVAVLGNTGGALTGGQAQPVLERAGIPIIASATSNPLIWNGSNSYMISQPSLLSYESLIGYGVHTGLLPMAVTVADNPLGLQFAATLETKLAALNGGEGFVRTIPVPAQNTDSADIARQIGDSGARSVLNIVSAPNVLAIAEQLTQQDVRAAMMSVAPLSIEDLGNANESAGLMVTGFSYPPFDDPTLARFRAEMAAELAAGNALADIRTASPYALYGWVALQALEVVTANLRKVDARTISNALDNAVDLDLGGIVPPWTPSKEGPPGMVRVSNASTWFAAFEDARTIALAPSAISHEEILGGHFDASLPPAMR